MRGAGLARRLDKETVVTSSAAMPLLVGLALVIVVPIMMATRPSG
jgi:hypothetical protein